MTALQIFTGNDQAPDEAEAYGAFLVEIIGRLTEAARGYGWAGAAFCWFKRQRGTVCIGVEPGEGWPGLDQLRDFRAGWTPPAEEEFELQEDGQGRMFG